MRNPFEACVRPEDVKFFSEVYQMSFAAAIIGLDNERVRLEFVEDVREEIVMKLERVFVEEGGLQRHLITLDKILPAFNAPRTTIDVDNVQRVVQHGASVLSDGELICFCFQPLAICAAQREVWCKPSKFWLKKWQAWEECLQRMRDQEMLN